MHSPGPLSLLCWKSVIEWTFSLTFLETVTAFEQLIHERNEQIQGRSQILFWCLISPNISLKEILMFGTNLICFYGQETLFKPCPCAVCWYRECSISHRFIHSFIHSRPSWHLSSDRRILSVLDPSLIAMVSNDFERGLLIMLVRCSSTRLSAALGFV